MEIKFSTGIDDPEVLKRIADDINTYGNAIEHIRPVHKGILLDILREHVNGEFNQTLNDFMVELYTTGKYDFYEAFMCTRAMGEKKIIPQFPLYEVFREFIIAASPAARDVHERYKELR